MPRVLRACCRVVSGAAYFAALMFCRYYATRTHASVLLRCRYACATLHEYRHTTYAAPHLMRLIRASRV